MFRRIVVVLQFPASNQIGGDESSDIMEDDESSFLLLPPCDECFRLRVCFHIIVK